MVTAQQMKRTAVLAMAVGVATMALGAGMAVHTSVAGVTFVVGLAVAIVGALKFDRATRLGSATTELRPPKKRDLAELRQEMDELQVIEAILPAAKAASKLRACGLRLVGSPEAMQVLRQMAADGNESAGWVVSNLLPQGHPEVVRR